jgi:SAM-dependent methyltransferase
MAPTEDYLLGHRAAEHDRLRLQAQAFAAEAGWLLDQLGIAPGWRAIDLGCGPRGVLDLLAARVGPRGTVVGLDQDEAAVGLARAFVAEHRLANVEVRQGDARETGLPRASFDLAHARLVLVNVPHPEGIVAEMAALVRPGGAVALEEADLVSLLCDPPLAAWARLYGAYEAYARDAGVDLYLGRRLPALLRAAGLVDVRVRPEVLEVEVCPPGHPRRLLFPHFVENVRDRLVARGLLSEEELTALLAAVRAHLADPATLVVAPMLFQAWGRTPSA